MALILNHNNNEELEMVDQDSDAGFSEQEPEPQPSFWQMIRQLFLQTASERQAEQRERLVSLTRAIESFPDAPINYLLRGELHLELGQLEFAREDCQQALALAEIQAESDRWGITAQSILDRARQHLEHLAQLDETD